MELYSTLGELILKTTDKTVIDISNFANGIYFLNIKQTNNCLMTKIVKH
ncbi:MAG: T9SS type A sorting domain-containing protein [Bacteroidia bacterium]|nr:T9SS type A sorting domain-containing protein [Bacteroidia bacterium]